LGFNRGLEKVNIRRGLLLEKGFEREKKTKKTKISSISVSDRKRQNHKKLIENRHFMWRHSIVVFFSQKQVEKCGILGIVFQKMVYWKFWNEKMVLRSKSHTLP
jgi:hypothetical protein